MQANMHRIGARGHLTTSVMHQLHFARQTLKFDGLQGGIIEFDGLHSKPSHLTVGTPDHSRYFQLLNRTVRSSMLHAMPHMNGAAARDVNHVNEAIKSSAFSWLQTRVTVFLSV